MRRTKIVVTVGPANAALDRLRSSIRAGASAFRLNCSHGSDGEHREYLREMHRAFALERTEGAILVDVQGPKIRIGPLGRSPITLVAGATWTLDDRPEPGDDRRVRAELPRFRGAARPGDPVLLADGLVQLTVVHAEAHRIVTRVVHGGPVGSHAGLYLPKARLTPTILSPKDLHDIEVVVAEGIDYLGLSFVRDAGDVRRARRELDRHPGGASVGIIAKIERAEALVGLDGILDEADAVMVARGDLGIEVPLERLAIEQKSIIRRANDRARPVVVATQMLLSMVHSPRPTRAEATDVANAVLDGADAVMLSEESAVGDYPVESVAWLDRICAETEGVLPSRAPPSGETAPSLDDSVAQAAVDLAGRADAAGIVTPTHSGRTARLISRLRPRMRVIALSADPSVRRRLALAWGVEAATAPSRGDLDDLRRWSQKAADAGSLPPGPLVVTAGYPVEGRPTNLVTVIERTPAHPRRRR